MKNETNLGVWQDVDMQRTRGLGVTAKIRGCSNNHVASGLENCVLTWVPIVLDVSVMSLCIHSIYTLLYPILSRLTEINNCTQTWHKSTKRAKWSYVWMVEHEVLSDSLIVTEYPISTLLAVSKTMTSPSFPSFTMPSWNAEPGLQTSRASTLKRQW